MSSELGVVVADGDNGCMVRTLGRRAASPAVLADAMADRGLSARPGDLVRVEPGEPGRIVYRWQLGRIVNVDAGVITLARPHRHQLEQAWILRRLVPAPAPGMVVFTDARNRRAVIVDMAGPDGEPVHPDRFGEAYGAIRDDIANMTFWLRPRPVDKMHNDAIDIDDSMVRRLLAAQFPQWSPLPLRRMASMGTVHAIYRLGENMAVRLPLATRFDGDTDRHWLDYMAPRVSVAVPRVLGVGAPGAGYPCRWVVVDWLPGRPWAMRDIKDGVAAAVEVAGFIRDLQRIGPDEVPFDCIDGDDRLALMDRSVQGAAEAARQWVGTDAVLEAWERALAAPAWHAAPVLLHGDLLAGNVLTSGGRLSAIIDWGNVHFGDPARDLAAAWNLFTGQPRQAFVQALGFDQATWARAHGLALSRVTNVAYYAETNRAFVHDALHTITEALADHPDTW